MRLEIRGAYPSDWPAIARQTRAEARYRCVRCQHPFSPEGRPLACDQCDRMRCRATTILERGGTLSLTVHHLDGDKGNCLWWNLLSLCNACHLRIQSCVIPERPWLFDHSPWFVPYVCGFYASFYGGLEITRAQAESDSARWLRLNPAR